jgi:hypothetical protein
VARDGAEIWFHAPQRLAAGSAVRLAIAPDRALVFSADGVAGS